MAALIPWQAHPVHTCMLPRRCCRNTRCHGNGKCGIECLPKLPCRQGNAGVDDSGQWYIFERLGRHALSAPGAGNAAKITSAV